MNSTNKIIDLIDTLKSIAGENEEHIPGINIEELSGETIAQLIEFSYLLNDFTKLLILDNIGKIIYVNSNFCDLFGYKCGDLKERNISFLRSSDDEPFIKIDLLKNVFKGNIWDGHNEIKDKDGNLIWTYSKVVPLKNKFGEIARFFVITFNVTNEIHNFEKYKEYEKNLKALTDSTPNSYFLLDTNKYLITFNKTAEINTKKFKSKKLTTGEHFYDIMYFLDKSAFNVGFKFAREGKSSSIQNYFEHKGKGYWYDIDFKLISDGDHVIGISVSCLDITQQKDYQDQLHFEKERLRHILNNAPIGILLVDVNFERIISSNPSAQKILGYSETELHNMGIRLINHSDDVEEEINKLKKLGNHPDKKFEYTKRLISKQGKTKWVNTILSKISINTSQNTSLMIFTDITKKHKDEIIKSFLHDLAVSVNSTRNLTELYALIHRYMTNIVNTTNFFIADFNARKNTVSFPYFVDQYEENAPILNATESGSLTAEIINRKTGLLIKKDEIINKYGADEELGPVPEVWLGVPLMMKNKVIGAIVVQNYEESDAYSKSDLYLFESVSHQIARAIEIKTGEREILRLKAGIDQSTNSIIIIDKDGIIEYVNMQYLNSLNMTANQVIGKKYEHFFTLDEECCDLFDKMMSSVSKGNLWKADIKSKDQSKRTIWESVTATPIKDEKDNIMSYLIAREDITERKRIYGELKKSKEEAEKLSNFKSNVLTNLSHELRTPLNGILGFIHILKKEVTSKENLEFVNLIQSSSHRLLNTLNSLLTLSSLESSEYKIVKNYVNLDEIIEFSLIQFRDTLEEKNLEIKFIKKIDKLTVFTDENIVSQIVKELVDNAIKYTDSGTIEIAVDKKMINGKKAFCFWVSDTGPGIAKEKLDFIFDAFRQGSEGISRTYEGMGLGLTIAYKMAKLIDADISIESSEGKGSKFTVCLT